MLELSNRLKIGARTQPPEELSQAFVEFFKSKYRDRTSVEDDQAELALATYEHLQNTDMRDSEPLFTREDLRAALNALKWIKGRSRVPHNKLAKALFTELRRMWEASSRDREPVADRNEDILPFIQVMAQSGDAVYARRTIEQYWEDYLRHATVSPWLTLLRGLIYEGQDEEVARSIDLMEKYNFRYTAKLQQTILDYYAAHKGHMEMTKAWYNRPLSDGAPPTTRSDILVLELCIKKNELEWGETILKSLLEKRSHDRLTWKIVFQWSAAKGKSVDEIERMMQIMVKRAEEGGNSIHPDIDQINGLIEVANSKNDPYTAERYVALGQKLGIQPNARTHLLQLDYRLKVNDLGGARTAYARLQEEDVSENDDLPLINRLIVALCAESHRNYDSIMSLVDDLSERKARFEPDTVGALSMVHLRRGEMDDLVDLLNTYVFHYGLEQRASIRDILLQYCLDPANPTSQAWETYNLMRQTFPETDVLTRTELMKSFFSRNRADMATHVFGHMRQQQVKALRPTIPTYAACLAGIGNAEDSESLQIVHNMIKLDSEIEPDTQLRNGLMLAYSRCGNISRALNFFEEIVHSREGPSYATFQIAFRACERAGDGESIARDLWRTLQRFEIEVTREIYAAFVGALAGQGLFDECVMLIDNAEKDVGYRPDALLLGTFYNASPGSDVKSKVKEWVWAAYPSAYEDLLKLGQYTVVRYNEDGEEEQWGPKDGYFDIRAVGRDLDP